MYRPRSSTRSVLAASLVLLGTSCTAARDTVRVGAPPQVSFTTVSLPAPVLARPGLRLILDDPPADGLERAAAKLPGVAVVLAVQNGTARIRTGRRQLVTRVMWVDPFVFRSLTPPMIRDSETVWMALLKGQALLAPSIARRLGVRTGDGVRVDGERLQVGAVADASSSKLAGVILAGAVSPATTTRSELLIGVRPRVDLEELSERFRLRFDVARIERLRLGGAVGGSSGTPSDDQGLIPPMAYRILEDGFIAPDPAWVKDNITTETVPILGEVSCHRFVMPQLRAALSEVARRRWGHLIDPRDYGGCFVARFIDHDPERPLSMHAFGLAFDVNVSTNAVGTAGDLDPRIVRTFEHWGFSWGGRWNPPDPMHFELAALIRG